MLKRQHSQLRGRQTSKELSVCCSGFSEIGVPVGGRRDSSGALKCGRFFKVFVPVFKNIWKIIYLETYRVKQRSYSSPNMTLGLPPLTLVYVLLAFDLVCLRLSQGWVAKARLAILSSDTSKGTGLLGMTWAVSLMEAGNE